MTKRIHEASAKMWVIAYVGPEDLYWSNTEGWVDGETGFADIFTQHEHDTINLPASGAWMPWNISARQ